MARGEERQAAETEFKEGFKIRFKQLREEKGMTQAAFADFLELSRPTIGFYENGDRMPDALALRRIAEKCEVSADYLVGTIPQKTTDIDMQAMCAKSGLSETNLAYIVKLQQKKIKGLAEQDRHCEAKELLVKKEYFELDALNAFLAETRYINVFFDIARLLNAVSRIDGEQRSLDGDVADFFEFNLEKYWDLLGELEENGLTIIGKKEKALMIQRGLKDKFNELIESLYCSVSKNPHDLHWHTTMKELNQHAEMDDL